MAVTIGELIITCKGTRTYSELEKDCGGIPTQGRIQQLATRAQHTFPSPDTIRGLARGLRVNPMTVISACAVSLGLADEAAEVPLVQLLPAGAETLNDGQVRTVIEVVRTLVDGNNRTAEAA